MQRYAALGQPGLAARFSDIATYCYETTDSEEMKMTGAEDSYDDETPVEETRSARQGP